MKYYAAFQTTLGYVAILGEDGKLIRCTIPKITYDDAVSTIDAGLLAGGVEDISAFGDLPDRFSEYFLGRQVDFSDVQIETCYYGKFQAKVLLAAKSIQYGTLITYKELAAAAGNERAARAAGNTMAKNMTPIVVPCHRVVAAHGKIGGFSLGIEWKRKLLKLEGVEV